MDEKKTINVTLRKGERKDCHVVASLIKELAEYEKQPEEAKLSGEDLERDGFNSDPPYFYTILAELNDESSDDNGKIIGFALYHYAYNTWKGQSLHLEEIYVSAKYRFRGIGEKLLKYLSKISTTEGLSKISLECLNWNEPTIKFYNKHGAENVTIAQNWHNFRFVKDVMKTIAE